MNTRYVLTLCMALVIGGALITGSAHALGKADEKTPINDTWMTAKTKIALFADSRVQGERDQCRDHTGLGDDPWQGGFRRGEAGGGKDCQRDQRRQDGEERTPSRRSGQTRGDR